LVVDLTVLEAGVSLALLLVLRPNPSGVRYLELPSPSGPVCDASPLAALSEDIHAKFQAKYGRRPSQVLHRDTERRVMQAVAAASDEGSHHHGWTCARFIVVEPELPMLPLQEIRLIVRQYAEGMGERGTMRMDWE
jgi:hypothetical protein